MRAERPYSDGVHKPSVLVVLKCNRTFFVSFLASLFLYVDSQHQRARRPGCFFHSLRSCFVANGFRSTAVVKLLLVWSLGLNPLRVLA